VHLLLTDRLACPRCGPEFGLILIAHDMRDRRVLEGALGCANCRDQFPVSEGLADLRPPPRRPLGGSPGESGVGPDGSTREGAPGAEAPIRIAAFLGIPGGPGTVLLVGGVAKHAPALSGLIQGVEWIAAPNAAQDWSPEWGVSGMVVRGRLPFYSQSLRGMVFRGDLAPVDAGEAARVLSPRGRVVILDPDRGTREELLSAGLSLVLEEGPVLIVTRKS
jgi:uncharacterized protein YbaR (Trm112 family)